MATPTDWKKQQKSGKYTYGPTPGPDPCGKVVWLCNGEEYNSESDYKSTSCVAVTQWSAEGVAAANQSRNEMNSTSSSSSSSSNQGDLPTTTDETPSDDF